MYVRVCMYVCVCEDREQLGMFVFEREEEGREWDSDGEGRGVFFTPSTDRQHSEESRSTSYRVSHLRPPA